jgi:hypothetical protein
MKTTNTWAWEAKLLAVVLVSGFCVPRLAADGSSPVWTYQLIEGSQLVDDCPICDRIPIVVPMRGSFQLRLLSENPLFATYALENIAFVAGAPPGPLYKVSGKGIYQQGGEVALVQDLFLELAIADGFTNRPCFFANAMRGVERLWPMLKIGVDQTNGTEAVQYHLDIAAAPFRELWFSTTRYFHAGVWKPPTNAVSAGDLISSAGRVVKRNQALTARLGIMPIVPDLGLDAVDVLPGGEIAFSITQDIFSERLGPLHDGDVLSDQGRLVKSYADLIGAFGPEPPPMDQGLDALQTMDNGEIWFSVRTNFFSETLGREIRRGDLLSSRGHVVKPNEQLIARFQPASPKNDYGLQALYVWPSGEIWFATETGFTGSHFEPYAAGDLLSDQGYVVYRNLELVSPFAPTEKLADFGLDALFVVTDVTPPPPSASCTRISPQPSNGNLLLDWDAPGRVWQLEKAADVLGPYLPFGPITTDPQITDAGSVTNQPRAFYRLRQW